MTDNDARLVRRARDGDAAAFEALVRRHLDAVYAVALGELGDSDEADDVSQDAFVTALERLDGLRKPERFGPWVRQIARNHARDARRRRVVRVATPIDEVHGLAGGADPARDLARSEIRGRLAAAIEELPPERRTVLLLHDLEGWTHSEIAEELGVPIGTARSHLHYARRAVRKILGSEMIGEKSDE